MRSIAVRARLPETLARSARPSGWLRAGFVRYEHTRGWAWIYVRADRPIEPVDPFLIAPKLVEVSDDEHTRSPFTCLAGTFALFLPITAAQWESSIKQSPCPETLLRLWETVLGVYQYYVTDKKLPAGTAADYFWLILDFCSGDSEDILRHWQLQALNSTRAKRVCAELGRWFRREGSL